MLQLQGQDAVQQYLRGCKELGVDVVEVSTGFVSLPTQDLVNVVALPLPLLCCRRCRCRSELQWQQQQ